MSLQRGDFFSVWMRKKKEIIIFACYNHFPVKKRFRVLGVMGVLLVWVTWAYGQYTVSSVINQYTKVISVDGSDRVRVSDASAFHEKDTVLIIQMKGVSVVPSDDNSTTQDVNQAGLYEFIIIDKIMPGNQIIFISDLANTYEPDAYVQMVRVPGYSNVRVTGTLTCQPWDSVSGTGGVLVLIAENTLTLEADIDVTAKGFRGGTAADGTGNCSSTDSRLTNFFYAAGDDSAGFKGEGVVSFAVNGGDNRYPIAPDFIRGRGQIFTAGGGGNGRFGGGGGGALYGAGGTGGLESLSCGSPGSMGGIGGESITDKIDFSSQNCLFLGSGGGSGNGDGTYTATAGGSGGGLVVILADTLVGNGHVIRADGEDVSAVATASGGGGGSGGMVALEVRDFKNLVDISARGGRGGDSNGDCTDQGGSGGGGGGGIIWTSHPSLPTEINAAVEGGSEGTACGSLSYGNPGNDGNTLNNLRLQLTGFLFNTIFSTRTGEYYDTLCEGEVMPALVGSDPKGGTPGYDYVWEQSADKVTWTTISGETERDLDLGIPLFDTTYFRRVVTDNSSPTIKDVSKVLTIIVQPEITKNRLSFDTVICYGQQPSRLEPVDPVPEGGDGTYAYLWEQSTDATHFSPADGVHDQATYQPPVLTDTTYYRRWVYSGKCMNVSDTVTITVLPLIQANTIGTSQTICEGETFTQLTGTVPSGGDGTYIYAWIESADGTTWNPGYGPNNASSYQPDTASPLFPGEVYFRRVVYSGLNNTCADTSNGLVLTEYPAIGNNTIASDQHICEGEVPMPLTGSTPTGGDHTYSYVWLESSDGVSFVPAAGTNTDIGYSPGALYDTTRYRRVVVSNVCHDTSHMVTVTVDPAITGYGISLLSGAHDTTVCEGVPLHRLVPSGNIDGGDGSYAYEWQQTTDGGTTWLPTGGLAADFLPAPLSSTTLFRRVVTSGMCSAVSDTVTVNVLPALSNNVLPADLAVCDGADTLLDGSTPAGGDGAYRYVWEESADGMTWGAATGDGSGEDYRTPALHNIVHYRRIVLSGPLNTCRDTSGPVQVDIYPLPSAVLTVLDTAVCSGSSVELEVTVTGVNGPWQAVLDDGLGGTVSVAMTATPATVTVTPESEVVSRQYTYTLASLTDMRGCAALPASLTGQARVRADGMPSAEAGPDVEVCGLTATLQGTPPAFGTALWTLPVGVTVSDPADAQATVTATAEGSYQLGWQVSNGVCPTVTDQTTVIFWQEPGDVHAPADTSLEPGSREITLAAMWNEPQVGALTWSTTSPAVIDDIHSMTIHANGLVPGENLFRVEVSNGICPVKSDEVVVHVPDFNAYDFGISPNHDGLNDRMVVPGAENVENTLTIFDVNGTVVFRTDNFMHADNPLTVDGWGGVNNDNEPLPDGTYFYILEMKGNVRETMKGYIVIKRRR